MVQGQLALFLRHIRRLAGRPGISGASDRQLLERSVARHDESAFALLVQRHGLLVLGVCRRILHNEHDAEDAFQASFLVLARKAASLRWHESVASWLYEVASRVAAKAKADGARRQAHERQATVMPTANPLAEAERRELQAVLAEEIGRLPEKYRSPLLLCCLEGVSRSEAAQQLGWKEGTVAGRLARARELLRKRLTRRGVSLSAGLLESLLAEEAAATAVPAALGERTIQAALLFAADGVSAPAAALAEGVFQAMVLTKLKIATAVLLAVSAIATGAGVLAQRTAADRQTVGTRSVVYQSGAGNPPEAKQGRVPKPAARDGAKPPAERAERPQPREGRPAAARHRVLLLDTSAGRTAGKGRTIITSEWCRG